MKHQNKIMVVGGAGFLGSHLCDKLLKNGNEVLCVDNFSTGSMQNVASLCSNFRFTFLEQDIVNPFNAEAGQIYNLGCPASPIHYQADPIQTIKTSVYGANNLLELARKNGARILQASTSEVYGDPVIHPQPETYKGNVNPIGLRACYDEGKRCAESLFFDYHRVHGVEIKILRIFNTYGPKMHPNDGRVVSNFIVQALKGEDITVYGDGTQTRSFCYVDDLIDCIFKMMNTSDEVIGPINAGNPTEFTIIELAENILSLIGGRSRIIFKPLPSDDPKQRKPDISRAIQGLNWEPKVSLFDGLKRTIEYFREII